jgi:hypothetical protein
MTSRIACPNLTITLVNQTPHPEPFQRRGASRAAGIVSGLQYAQDDVLPIAQSEKLCTVESQVLHNGCMNAAEARRVPCRQDLYLLERLVVRPSEQILRILGVVVPVTFTTRTDDR